MSIGKRIEAARRARRLTQTQLGEIVGRSKGAISQWEHDLGQPDLVLLARMCDELRVSADWLVRGLDTTYVDAAALALAARIQALPPDTRASLTALFGPAATDERVSQFLPPAPRQTDKN